MRLQIARDYAGIPFVVVSWCRCERHNKDVGGTKYSSHLKAIAVDIRTRGIRERYVIIHALTEAGFNRIGIKRNSVHVDYDKSKPQNLIWLYKDD